jgi:ArsR family transcriptional regulator, arsenate/arsenite/antimonite-responsive transcriptional repressor
MKNTARILKALADETRLRILALLLDSGELCVCDLMAALQLPQSTVSRHLAYLKNAGWLDDRREGVWMYYQVIACSSALQDRMLAALREELAALATHREDRERLGEFRKSKSCI